MITVASAAYLFYARHQGIQSRTRRLISWLRRPERNPEWAHQARTRCRESTPFFFPTSGYIGYLWGDIFRLGHRHQGIDIFAGTAPGLTPVYAAYDGYLTRLPSWKSSLILRVPQDPLNPERQIWLYYTHLADPEGSTYILAEYPPGSEEIFVEEGDLLGYQGNFSGTPGKPVGVHLHFSIVQDDGEGQFLNELEINNTLDPSPYFDLNLNSNQNRNAIPSCQRSSP